MNMEHVYFISGDLVTLNKKELNAPVMMVKGKKSSHMKDATGKTQLIGIVCCWFTKDFVYQEQVFNTKDLDKL